MPTCGNSVISGCNCRSNRRQRPTISCTRPGSARRRIETLVWEEFICSNRLPLDNRSVFQGFRVASQRQAE
jgi:hypothetical protein